MFLKTSGNFSYLTFASGGYIIRINPIAIGMFVVPELNEFQNVDIPDQKYPIITPVNITRNIQRVRYRSKNESCFVVPILTV
jgi:hypothetical protein